MPTAARAKSEAVSNPFLTAITDHRAACIRLGMAIANKDREPLLRTMSKAINALEKRILELR